MRITTCTWGAAARAILLTLTLGACSAASSTPRFPPLAVATAVSVDPPTKVLPPESSTADSTHFSFVFYGGMRGREDGIDVAFEHLLVAQAMLDTIKSREGTPNAIRFILSNGDAVLDGREARQWIASWIPIANRLTRESGLPYFMAAGNHDVTEATYATNFGRRQGLANMLRSVGALIPPDGDPHRLAHYPTYTVAYGNVFVVVFDSNIGDDVTQLDWVRKQLNALDRKRYTVVIGLCHHPAFSSGPHGYAQLERATLAMRNRWMPLFRHYRARLVLAGHDHLYEHWVERYHDEAGWHRLDQIVSGGGGAPLYTYQGEPDLSVYLGAGASDSVQLTHLIRPGRVPAENPYHFTVIHVDGDQLRLEVIGVGGGARFRPYGTETVSLSDSVPQR